MRYVLGFIVAVSLSVGGTFGLSYLGYETYRYFAPRYEQVRYDTFKQSQTYNDGMLRDLQELKREYLSADDEHKVALKAIVRHRFEVYDINRLPPDLVAFYLDATR